MGGLHKWSRLGGVVAGERQAGEECAGKNQELQKKDDAAVSASDSFSM